LLLIASLAGAEARLPKPLDQVGFDQRLGQPVPAELRFRDETGRQVRLADYLGRKPVVLVLAYYECPMLCTMVLNGLVGSLRALEFSAGREFDIVTVSFDPREPPALAAAKKSGYLSRYGRAGAAAGWHFLTGAEPEIQSLTRAVGFRYVYDPESDQFAHASGIVILTPDGRIARYLYGVEFAPRDLRLGLVEASANRIGSVVDQVLLFCFHYDPKTGRYSAAALGSVRIGAALTVAALGLFVASMVRRERRATGAAGPAAR
jgi:protein SCO1/2